jgi:hypothetical protein
VAWLERNLALSRAATRALFGVLIALLAVFGVIAVNVATIRGPLDHDVDASFAAAAPRAALLVATAKSHGCRKTRVDFYNCAVEVTRRRSHVTETLVYKLNLAETGCWNAVVVSPRAALGRFPLLSGCVASAD